MCVLMLRGAQTLGELRGNGGRLHEFSSLEEVEETLNKLITRDPDPLVARLPRQPGQKEGRFAHLLSGEIDIQTLEQTPPSPSRRTSLEEKVEALTAEVEKLKEQFEQFRKQFE
jgi:hypothetical protein